MARAIDYLLLILAVFYIPFHRKIINLQAQLLAHFIFIRQQDGPEQADPVVHNTNNKEDAADDKSQDQESIKPDVK